MIPQDRNDRRVAVVIAVGFHVLLLVVLIRVTASRRSRSEMPHDTPVTAGEFLGDVRPASGTAREQEPLSRYVRCEYALLPASREARLVQGPLETPGRLGCNTTLSLVKAVTSAAIAIQYDQTGQIVEISGDENFQGSETAAVVAGWRLARPRDGYQWLEKPVYEISIRPRTN